MRDATGTPTAIRERNLRVLLRAARDGHPVSRADLAASTGLSKPTVGGGLRALEAQGLVREYGRTTGRRGPSASLYEFVADAVLVLGVDIGTQYVRAVLADLDGHPVGELTVEVDAPDAASVLRSVGRIRDELVPAAPRTALAVVGSPGVIDPVTGRIRAAPNLAGWEGLIGERVLGEALRLPVTVENDVNLAALGEQAQGAGRGVDSFAYLNIGAGLGAGLVLHGRLHRGGRGAAGEVGFLPVGPDPFAAGEGPHRGPMEARLSSGALAAMAERLSGELVSALRRPYTAVALFDAARGGDPLGRAVVAETARQAAICVCGISAVVDLDLVILGGGIGANEDLLAPDVRDAVAQLVPAPPRVEVARLGDRAARTGAVARALELAQDLLISRIVAAR